jgi:hypothetical protein
MAHFLLVHAEVRDYSEWKPAYDAHLPKRNEADLVERHVLHSAANPNDVFILFEARDLERAKSFMESSDLREAMQKSGVLGKPEFHFLESNLNEMCHRNPPLNLINLRHVLIGISHTGPFRTGAT